MVKFFRFRMVTGNYNCFAVPAARESVFKIQFADYGCQEVPDFLAPKLSFDERSQVLRGEILVYWQQYATKHWIPVQ